MNAASVSIGTTRAATILPGVSASIADGIGCRRRLSHESLRGDCRTLARLVCELDHRGILER